MSKRQIASATRERLEIMTQSTDGFVIAEADMKMRGPGNMEGTQQSGLAFNMRLASLATDGQMIAITRDAASDLLDANPQLYGATTSPAESSGSSLTTLSPSECNIINNELKFRFSQDTDWSRIS